MDSVVRLLNVLAAIVGVRGHGEIAQYLRVAATAVSEAQDAESAFAEVVAEIEQMVADGRNPTPEEFAAARERRQQLSEEIRNTVIEDNGGPVVSDAEPVAEPDPLVFLEE